MVENGAPQIENNRLGLADILTEEQIQLIDKEDQISAITLSSEGKINTQDSVVPVDDDKRLKEWQAKAGVIDTQFVGGVLVVIYNSNIGTPEGLPNVREKGREGEFDPFNNISYTDISNTYNFLEEKYEPSWVQQNVRHEARHALVSKLDDEHGRRAQKKERRVVDQEVLRAENPELFRQLSYLDELHSQYFDVIDSGIEGYNSFRSLKSNFYSIAGVGTHEEVAASTVEGRQTAKELFHLLQGMILLKRMGNIEDISVKGAGVVLATERSIGAARDKVKLLWKRIIEDPKNASDFRTYLQTYKPSLNDNTPEITKDLLKELQIDDQEAKI